MQNNQIELVDLYHANMRDEAGSPIGIKLVKNQIFSWFYSTASKATHVVSVAGAVVPVLNTPEELTKLLVDSKPNKKGKR